MALCAAYIAAPVTSFATTIQVRRGITEKTARLIMLKIKESMGSNDNHPKMTMYRLINLT
ncbi:MAG: hypothetical protein KDC68_00405 [Gelidibacter sp.]|nr:hypothetical protein [Gelidibacter sp.]